MRLGQDTQMRSRIFTRHLDCITKLLSSNTAREVMGMSGRQPDNENLLAEKVRGLLGKIQEEGKDAEELADLYVQLEETLNQLDRIPKSRHDRKGAYGLFIREDKPKTQILTEIVKTGLGNYN